MQYKTKLSMMASTGKAKDTSLRTGVAVPASGIYRVSHPQHNLPVEVTLLKDQKFPRCSRCNEPVFYELLRSAPAVTSSHPSTFQVELYELPELLPDDEIAS